MALELGRLLLAAVFALAGAAKLTEHRVGLVFFASESEVS